MEKKIDDFYNVVQKEILNYFTAPNGKNEYLSYERIRLLIENLIDFLHCESFYIFNNSYEQKNKIKPFQIPKLFSFTVVPQKVRRNLLDLCIQCTLLYAEIFDNIVCDIPFLLNIFEHVKEYDEFSKRIINICERIYLCKEHGRDITKDIRCIIGRSDYMLNCINTIASTEREECQEEIKQIEYNTISVAFGNLSSVIFEAHKNMIKEIYKEYFPYMEKKNEKEIYAILDKKFRNNFLEGIIKCISTCHRIYMEKYPPAHSHNKTITICVLHDDDRNNFDKYKTKWELNKLGIGQKYFTITELQALFVNNKLFLNYPNETVVDSVKRVRNSGCPCPGNMRPGKLLLDLNDNYTRDIYLGRDTIDGGNLSIPIDNCKSYERNIFEVSVIYFRSLYSPAHFSEVTWALREMIEYSDSVKIPSLPYQLVGLKRIQMLLLDDNILRKYISFDVNKKKKTEEQIVRDINMLKKTFALQVDPSLTENSDIVSQAIKNENNFLLKPQREGGKNNLHGQDVRETLMLYYNSEEKRKLSYYVLMQRLFPSLFTAVHCRTRHKGGETTNGKDTHGEEEPLFVTFSPEHSISEISLFHNFIFRENENVLNEQKGYLVRTKNAAENEGGAICGISSLDSFFLV
ncbi:glutathione synthetase (GS) [Plasmodium ovale wallikeri]|uniref:Glutathione synthetase n=2 Tax=Plasmodium ovale TaxID=36330 RepID=A0A1A8YZ37_PLAOA|nr:glutathione synthetase (GS) [Plasmodium ovale wallikeri]SBT36807.1 glutathione synthetase (GS) [Plasmodium ovale wallikeri]SBT73620.1 glutathione synthetase, putative [Plasmodium ovale]